MNDLSARELEDLCTADVYDEQCARAHDEILRRRAEAKNAEAELQLAMTSREDRVWLRILVDDLAPERARARAILLRLIEAGEMIDAGRQTPVRPSAPWDPTPGPISVASR